MSAPTVAVLGLGEAGGRLAADLAAAGVAVTGYDPVAPEDGGIQRASDPASAVAGADVVLCCTAASAALGAASAALPGLKPDAVYADLNTAPRELKRELADLVGDGFADVALLGAVPARGLRTPTLASGPGARKFAAAFEPLGMPVDVVSGEPGDAAVLKLVRSVFMKGMAAAALESLAAADAAGHAGWARRQLDGAIGEQLVERLLDGSRRHAARRVDEMQAACELLVSLDVEPRIAAASRDVLAGLADEA
jgi:3-hydroxyisobutyrate dehydrogenase-like beta-hydroxyacid dehydrogenase